MPRTAKIDGHCRQRWTLPLLVTAPTPVVTPATDMQGLVDRARQCGFLPTAISGKDGEVGERWSKAHV